MMIDCIPLFTFLTVTLQQRRLPNIGLLLGHGPTLGQQSVAFSCWLGLHLHEIL